MGKSTISMAIFNSYFDITRGYVIFIPIWEQNFQWLVYFRGVEAIQPSSAIQKRRTPRHQTNDSFQDPASFAHDVFFFKGKHEETPTDQQLFCWFPFRFWTNVPCQAIRDRCRLPSPRCLACSATKAEVGKGLAQILLNVRAPSNSIFLLQLGMSSDNCGKGNWRAKRQETWCLFMLVWWVCATIKRLLINMLIQINDSMTLNDYPLVN